MSITTVEDLFSRRSYEAQLVVETGTTRAVDRKRVLVHSIAEVTQKILAQPNANPAGLAVTVTQLPAQPDVRPNLLIVATCPQFEMVESSYT